jgi:hypothetical protein
MEIFIQAVIEPENLSVGFRHWEIAATTVLTIMDSLKASFLCIIDS